MLNIVKKVEFFSPKSLMVQPFIKKSKLMAFTDRNLSLQISNIIIGQIDEMTIVSSSLISDFEFEFLKYSYIM